MRRRLGIAGAVVAGLLPLALALALGGGCAGNRPVVAAGGACDLAADCAPGLVCVPVNDDVQEMVRDLKHNPWKFLWRE